MESSLSAYPMYTDKESRSIFCQLHNHLLCAHICAEILCPKNGLICSECLKLSIHKPHISKVYTVEEAINYISQSLKDDNFDIYLPKIQEVQEIFSETISFFKEKAIPSFLSLEKSLFDLKENFWNSLLMANTKILQSQVREIEIKNDQDKVSSLLLFLEKSGLSLSRLFVTDLKWYFDLAIQIIIDEFRSAILPYKTLIGDLKDNLVSENLLQNLTKLWIVKNSIKLSHGITNKKSYKYLMVNLKDTQQIAYFDWKFLYIYNYQKQKVNFTIKTPESINGIAFLEDQFILASFHYGSFLGTYGINLWDAKTGNHILGAENMKNVYNLVYLKKCLCFAYDSEDLYGSNYQISIFDLKARKTTKVLNIPNLNISDELFFKYDERKNLLLIKVTPDSNLPRRYDCLFVVFECSKFQKISTLPIIIEDCQNYKISINSIENSLLTTHDNFIMVYTPGTKMPLKIEKIIFGNEEILELGVVTSTNEKNILLISCRRAFGLQNIYSILIYDVDRGEIVGETSSVSEALFLNLMILDKGTLIVGASYDSKLLFLRKSI